MEGKEGNGGKGKRHNKIIYVVRNADGVRGGENANASERARANLCRSKTNTKAGTTVRWPMMATVCTVVWQIV